MILLIFGWGRSPQSFPLEKGLEVDLGSVGFNEITLIGKESGNVPVVSISFDFSTEVISVDYMDSKACFSRFGLPRIEKASVGFSRSLFLSCNGGKLLSSNASSNGFGIQDSGISEIKTEHIRRDGTKIVDIQAGDTCSIILMDNGEIFSLGKSHARHAQVEEKANMDNFLEHIEIPQPFPFIKLKIVKISCGWTHCLALSSCGEVFSWGSGLYGNLGHGNTEDQPEPKHICILQGMKIMQIACGIWHSAVLTNEGDIYTFGLNQNGQLGVNIDYSVREYDSPSEIYRGKSRLSTLPQLVEFSEEFATASVVTISCGARHTVALLRESSRSTRYYIFGWGWNKKGQIFPAPMISNVDSDRVNVSHPTLMYSCESTRTPKLQAGHWNTCVLLT